LETNKIIAIQLSLLIAFETTVFCGNVASTEMLACDWFKNCHDNAAKIKLQNFSSQNRRAEFRLLPLAFAQ